MNPFHANYCHEPYKPYPSLPMVPDVIPVVNEFLEALSNFTKIATDALVLAKANQECNTNKSRHEVVYQVDDQVLLATNHINLASQANQPIKKLQHHFIGPYHI